MTTLAWVAFLVLVAVLGLVIAFFVGWLTAGLSKTSPCPTCSNMVQHGEAPGGECPTCRGARLVQLRAASEE